MNENELKMTGSDLNKLSYNDKTSIKLYLIFTIVSLSILYITWSKENFPLKLILGLFLSVGLSGIFKQFFGQKKKKDLREKIKIVVRTKIIDKKTIRASQNFEDNDSSNTNYKILLENHKNYNVKIYIYDKIQISDEIEIEYAKYSKWILRIYCKSINIENSSHLQKY